MISLSTWNIGLSAWIIQDGNYPDFAVGEIVEFAVEFYQQPGTTVEVCQAEVFARQVTETAYGVAAQKVLATDDVTVLDIGILVYHEGALGFPEEIESGGRFRTQLQLGVDPYFYFERLSKDEGVPALIYSWITSILRQTAPFIEIVSDSGSRAGKTMIRDSSKLGYEEISRTDAWHDDDGYGEYILCSELLPIPAKRRSATAL